MEKSLEMCLACLDELYPFGKILNGIIEVHQPCVHKSPIKIKQSIRWLQRNCLLKLSQCVVNLIQHHHTVSSVSIILRMFVVKSDCCSEIIHGLLILSNSHESIASVSVIFGMGGSLITGGGTLEAGDCLTKFLDGYLCIFFFLFFVKFLKMILSISIEFVG